MPIIYHRKRVLSIDKQKRAARNNKYGAKVYTQIAVRIPKELAATFKTVTAERGDSQAAIIKEAITNYLNSEQNAESFKINPKK